jgi:hypothetical protein
VRASLAALACFLIALPAASAASGPTLHFRLSAQTDLPLGQATWTGREWLYVAENLGQIETAGTDGRSAGAFAAFDQGGEEMRCAVPPNGFWPDGVYCHTPDNRVVRLDRDGSHLTQVAKLPAETNSDGALAFDDAGRFGYALLVATGGSGTDGGQLFAVRRDGRVQPIASYPGPGGAENIAIAPKRFGSAGGWCLLAVDQDSVSGRLLAIDRKGVVKTIATGLGTGANPLLVVKGRHVASGPAAGFYLADTLTKAVWFAPAVVGAGPVIVGSELTGQLWSVAPSGRGFRATPLATDLPAQPWNLEGSAYVP